MTRSPRIARDRRSPWTTTASCGRRPSMPECRERVGKGVVTFSCSVPVPAGASSHEGPCAAIEVPRTMKQRENWEAEQRHQASGLGEFQGRAQTTAERYTDGATDPPGTEAPPPEPRVVRAGGVGEAL